MSDPFDWRAYAAETGVGEMRAWIAMQRASKADTYRGAVTSPKSLDRMCEDESMHDYVRAVIDDERDNRGTH